MTPAREPGAVVAQLLEAATRAARAPAAEPGPSRAGEGRAGPRIVGIGWATVELGRAAVQLRAALDLPADAWTPAVRDQLLGAAALSGPQLGSGADGPRLVLLEPDTEGRLAASLARLGEGVAAVYVLDTIPTAFPQGPAGDRPGGPALSATAFSATALSATAPGPLGRARLVLGGATWGPHVIVLDAPPNPESLPSPGD